MVRLHGYEIEADKTGVIYWSIFSRGKLLWTKLVSFVHPNLIHHGIRPCKHSHRYNCIAIISQNVHKYPITDLEVVLNFPRHYYHNTNCFVVLYREIQAQGCNTDRALRGQYWDRGLVFRGQNNKTVSIVIINCLEK